MSHKINCLICYRECKSDEMIYENYIPLDLDNAICKECLFTINQIPLVTKGER